MTANDTKFDQYNNTFHHCINKKSINADYSVLTKKIDTSTKSPKFKVNDRIRITKHKNISKKVTLKSGQEKDLLLYCFEN